MTLTLTLAIVLIVVGFVLLAAELIFPSGFLSAVALAAIAIGIALMFSYDLTFGVFTLLIVFVALPLFGGFVLHYWPKTPMGKRLILQSPGAEETLASTPENQELEQLVGRYGQTVSDLRPSGVTNFDGKRVDTITEGMMVDAGQWVRCIDVRAGKVVVRPVEKPDLGALETADFS
jgi:membrane-bound serine protease (ClpP class)